MHEQTIDAETILNFCKLALFAEDTSNRIEALPNLIKQRGSEVELVLSGTGLSSGSTPATAEMVSKSGRNTTAGTTTPSPGHE